jgi:hypothetical protein
MIHESAPWRSYLAKDAEFIDRWAAKTAITERRSILLERKVFLAAYAMRKLFEARKLTSSSNHKTVQCKTFPAIDRHAISSWNAYKFYQLYDFSSPSVQTVKLPDLLNLIIHSLLFSEVIQKNGKISAFFVTSDRKRSNLWLIRLSHFTSLMRYVAQDYPAVIHRVRDGETENWIEWRGKRRKA